MTPQCSDAPALNHSGHSDNSDNSDIVFTPLENRGKCTIKPARSAAAADQGGQSALRPGAAPRPSRLCQLTGKRLCPTRSTQQVNPPAVAHRRLRLSAGPTAAAAALEDPADSSAQERDRQPRLSAGPSRQGSRQWAAGSGQPTTPERARKALAFTGYQSTGQPAHGALAVSTAARFRSLPTTRSPRGQARAATVTPGQQPRQQRDRAPSRLPQLVVISWSGAGGSTPSRISQPKRAGSASL